MTRAAPARPLELLRARIHGRGRDRVDRESNDSVPRHAAVGGLPAPSAVKLSGGSWILAYGVVNDGAAPGSGATNDGSFVPFSNR